MVPAHWPHCLSCKDVSLHCSLVPFCLLLSCALPYVTVEFWNVLSSVLWLEKVMTVAVIGEHACSKRNASINLKIFLHFFTLFYMFFFLQSKNTDSCFFFGHKYILLKTGGKNYLVIRCACTKNIPNTLHLSAQDCCKISLLQFFFLNFEGPTSSYSSESEYYPSESNKQVLLS